MKKLRTSPKPEDHDPNCNQPARQFRNYRKRGGLFIAYNVISICLTIYSVLFNSTLYQFFQGNTSYVGNLYSSGLVDLPEVTNRLLKSTTKKDYGFAFGSVHQIGSRTPEMMNYNNLMCDQVGKWNGSTDPVVAGASLTNRITGVTNLRSLVLGHAKLPAGCNATQFVDVIRCPSAKILLSEIILAWNTLVKLDSISGVTLNTFIEQCSIETIGLEDNMTLYRLSSKYGYAETYEQYETSPDTLYDLLVDLISWGLTIGFICEMAIGIHRFMKAGFGKTTVILPVAEESLKKRNLVVDFHYCNGFGASYWLNSKLYLYCSMGLSCLDLRKNYSRTEGALYVYTQGGSITSMIHLSFTATRYSWIALSAINVIRHLILHQISFFQYLRQRYKFIQDYDNAWVLVTYTRLNVTAIVFWFLLLNMGVDNIFEIKQILDPVILENAVRSKGTESEVQWNTCLYVTYSITISIFLSVFSYVFEYKYIKEINRSCLLQDLVQAYGIIGFDFKEVLFQVQKFEFKSTMKSKVKHSEGNDIIHIKDQFESFLVPAGVLMDIYRSISLTHQSTFAGIESISHLPTLRSSNQRRSITTPFDKAKELNLYRASSLNSFKSQRSRAGLSPKSQEQSIMRDPREVSPGFYISSIKNGFDAISLHLIVEEEYNKEYPPDGMLQIQDGLFAMTNEQLGAIICGGPLVLY